MRTRGLDKWYWPMTLLAILFLLLFAKRSDDPMAQKRRMTNLLALAVFVSFILIVVAFKSREAIKINRQIEATKAVLEEVANYFAEGDLNATMQWARGEYKDAWQNTVVLNLNDEERGVQFISKGPDEELYTEDDVHSSVFKMVIQEDAVWVEKVDKAVEKADGWWQKTKRFFGKEAEDDNANIRDG
jgi:prophage tail gpP-like protein